MKYSNFSIVIPIFNEAHNIEELLKEIHESLKECYDFEIIIVNDFSSDNSKEIIIKYLDKYKINLINNKKNYGQSFSISCGIKNSAYNTIVTIDGDGQNNPNDIPKLLYEYFADREIKLVGGIRYKRQDSYVKKISSKIANNIRKIILNDKCDDTGCSLKVFDKKIFLLFPYFNGIHRFLPALFTGYGYNTKFIKVDHRKRKFGYSKYGTFDRLIRGVRDIFKVLKIRCIQNIF